MTPEESLKWIEDNLVFTPSAGPKLSGQLLGPHLLGFQREILLSALRGRNVFVGFSRKISKSACFGWLITHFLVNREGYNIIGAASTFGQSDVIFKEVVHQIVLNPRINEKDFNITKLLIENEDKHNTFAKIFSKSTSNLGLTGISCFVADELGAWQSRENLDSIQTGMGFAQDNKPLLMYASNPASTKAHWSNEFLKTLKYDKDWEFYDYSTPIKEKNIFSDKSLSQANPFFKEYLKTKNPHLKSVYSFLKKEVKLAQKSSEQKNIFRRWHLGQRISSKAYEWINPDDLQTIPEKLFEDKKLRKDLRAVMGFDLALSSDFCSAVLGLFSDADESCYFYPHLHLANLDNRTEAQKSLFTRWFRDGHITIQDKPAICKDTFISSVKATLKKWKIDPEAFVWDRNLSSGWTEAFSPDPLLVKGTGFELSHSIRWLEARSKEHKVHISNPCLRWMIENAVCSNRAKNVILDRDSWRNNIDGAVASVLCTKHFIENRRPDFEGFAI